MQTVKKFFPLFSVAFFVVLALALTSIYVNEKTEELKNQQYKQASVKLKKELRNLIKAKQKASMSIPLLLSEDSSLKQILKSWNDTFDLGEKFKHISKQLRDYTDYKNVWIQIIDRNGVSLSRS